MMPRKPLANPTSLKSTLAGLILCLSSGAFGQTARQPLAIDGLTASKHWIAPPSPKYPMHAKQLHIQGSVSLEMTVNETGEVTLVRALSGPQELQQAAIDAYSHVRFRPFMDNGKPSPAIISTKINFDMNEAPISSSDQAPATEYFELHAKCDQLSSRKSSDALKVCLQAVEASKKLPSTLELESRAITYNEAAKLLFEAGRPQEAEQLGMDVVPLVAPAGRMSQASVNALMTRAEVKVAMGNAVGAIDDLNEILSILDELKAKETSPVFQKMFQTEHNQMLHAKSSILRQLGRGEEAKEVEREATK